MYYRHISLFQHTAASTYERAISGITSGLISKGETVTWKAKHFGVTQTLTSEISKMECPYLFEDRMIAGAFKKIVHLHTFEFVNGQTIMKDVFEFDSPWGILGSLFNKIILTNYMRRFLYERNQMIKMVAETEEWKKYLKS